jgi:sec-independent protein translocase protein TatA
VGVGGISIWQLLIILVIVILLFGTKRLKNVGSDLGNAIKSFRSSMRDAQEPEENNPTENLDQDKKTAVIEGQISHKNSKV